MKNLLMIAAVAAVFTACNDEKKTDTYVSADTTATITTDAAPTGAPAMAEGDLKMTGGKMMVWRNNDWVALDKPITLTYGGTVSTTGEVKFKDGKTYVVTDGGMVRVASGEVLDSQGTILVDNTGVIVKDDKIKTDDVKIKDGKIKTDDVKIKDGVVKPN